MESLAATGVAGRPGEFFQYFATSSLSPQPREWFAGVDDEKIVGALAITDPGTVDTRTADQWRADVLAEGLTPSGVWGGKLMWNQTPLLIARTRVASGSLRTALRWLLGRDYRDTPDRSLSGLATPAWLSLLTLLAGLGMAALLWLLSMVLT